MTRTLLLAVLACGCARSGVIHGVVLDHATGRPLARALVNLQAVTGAAGAASARTTSGGQFTFSPVAAGAYLITASRPGFATLKYGQKTWNAPAAPVFVDEGGNLFLNLRLRRLGVISGIIWDENEIGLPDQEVLAYRPTRPPVVAAKAKTDDRGAFRITGLAPGAYLVRTAAHPLDEWTGVLPTFYREVVTVDDARTVDTDLDHETPDIDFRPNFGKLVRLSGRAVTFPPVSLTVELISDMGKVTTTTGGNGQFSFESVAPGDYELLAHGFRGGMIAGYEPVHVEKDLEVVTLPVNQLPVVRPVFEMQDGTPVDPKLITIVGRRKALSGEGPGEVLTASGAGRRSDQFEVLPGRWRILVLTPPNLYPVSMSRAKGRIDGWTEIDFGESRTDRLRIVLSDRPGSIRGKVTGPGQEPAAAAPVYLEAYDADAHRRLLDPRSVRTDLRGDYSFRGLPPGLYRIMSTFEIENPDEKQMDYANCPVVTVKEGEEVVRDLAMTQQ